MESNKPYRELPDDRTTLPSGIPYIVGNEAAERFSYYGMRAILFIFLTQYLHGHDGLKDTMSPEEASEWSHNFMAAVYLTPILGAILSDWLFGKYRTILVLSIVYCLGHAVMALVDFPQWTGIHPRTVLACGLGLIAIGAGGIKPCVSAHVGDQFGPGNKHLLPRVYGWFYFSINIGATASTLLIPILLNRFGPGIAFGVPGILMAIATFLFWTGRHDFVHIPAAGSNFFVETFSSRGLIAMACLVPLYLLLAPFWALFDQTQSTWVYQAEQLDRMFGNYELLPSQIQAANPILVMAFIPLFAYVIYPTMEKFITVTPLRKIGIGLFLTAPAFALCAIVEQWLDAGLKPHIAWQLLAYVIMTAAEVMVSITALEFSYTQAPKTMKSFIMGAYLLSVSLGNKFTAQVNGYIADQQENGIDVLQGPDYFWFFTKIMFATAILYVFWSFTYRGKSYIHGEEVD